MTLRRGPGDGAAPRPGDCRGPVGGPAGRGLITLSQNRCSLELVSCPPCHFCDCEVVHLACALTRNRPHRDARRSQGNLIDQAGLSAPAGRCPARPPSALRCPGRGGAGRVPRAQSSTGNREKLRCPSELSLQQDCPRWHARSGFRRGGRCTRTWEAAVGLPDGKAVEMRCWPDS